MAKANTKAAAQREQVREIFERYGLKWNYPPSREPATPLDAYSNALSNPRPFSLPEFPVPATNSERHRWWLYRALKACFMQDKSAAFSEVLQTWLTVIGIPIPDGVFVPLAGAPGAPIKPENLEIHARWVDLHKPSLGKQKLAASFFGKEFSEASAENRIKLIDRCRQAVTRIEKRRSP